jgi:sec-independent protein translocase protein TatA
VRPVELAKKANQMTRCGILISIRFGGHQVFEGLFQPMHLLVIVAIVVVLFGPKKLPELGKGLGESIRGFKQALTEGESESAISAKNEEKH